MGYVAPDRKLVTFQMSPEDFEALKARAELRKTSVSDLVRSAIEDRYLKPSGGNHLILEKLRTALEVASAAAIKHVTDELRAEAPLDEIIELLDPSDRRALQEQVAEEPPPPTLRPRKKARKDTKTL